jgi:hypothetical protein
MPLDLADNTPWRCAAVRAFRTTWLSRQMFNEILSLIARLRAPPAPA